MIHVADLFVGEGVHPERLGIVSGESRVFEIAGDMEDEGQAVGPDRREATSVGMAYARSSGSSSSG